MSSKTKTKDLKDIDIFCTIKIKTRSQNSKNQSINSKEHYHTNEKDVKPRSGTNHHPTNPQSEHEWYVYSLKLINWRHSLAIGPWRIELWIPNKNFKT